MPTSFSGLNWTHSRPCPLSQSKARRLAVSMASRNTVRICDQPIVTTSCSYSKSNHISTNMCQPILNSIVVLLCFSQHQVKSAILPAACKNPCLFAAILLTAATSMNGSMTTAEPGSEILALRQETLLLVRQQLASPDASGDAEHIMAIQCLAGASFVSDVLLFYWKA